MGDPRKLRKKYSPPRHPWDAENIKLEKELVREYGLRNKKEIQKMISILKKYKGIAKNLITDKTKQGEIEKNQMMDKLQRLGLIQTGAALDSILDLEIKDILERRLQSLVCRKSLSRSMNQARQFITHRHVMVGSKKITSPSYLVSCEEEAQIGFDTKSTMHQEDHPERINPAEGIKEELAATKKKPEEKNNEKGIQKA